MALATQCPHCNTTFRVASDQLKLRGGIVRCGACQRIFDGSAHLVDLEALAASKAAAPPPPPPAPEPAPGPAPAAEQAPVAAPAPEPAPDADVDAQPVYTLDFGSTFDPLGILPKVDPEPAHGDVLAHAVEAAAAGDVSPPLPESEAVADPEPPHGDVLAHAVDTVAGDGTPSTAPEPEAATDPEPPHGDVLAHAVDSIVEVDVDLPPPEPEPGAGTDTAAVSAQPQDPEPPHGDALADAVDAAVSPTASAQPARISPRLEPRLEPRLAPRPQPEAPPAEAAPPAPEPRPAPVSFTPPGRIEPSFDLPVDEELVAQPLAGHEPDPEPAPRPASSAPRNLAAPAPAPHDDGMPPALPLRASAGAEFPETASATAPKSARAKATEARTRRSRLTPTRIEAPKLRVPETDEPEFVKRSRKQEQSGRTRRILMGVGAAVLLLALAAQVVLNFRNVLAARYPGARPALGAACALLGCRVELPTQIDNLAIENGELSTLGPDTYSLNTLLRNQGSLVQAWPSIELELTDANDKPVLRRVFTPAEYLPQGTSAAAGFGARSEQPIKLHFALAELKPSSYHIFIFYP